MGHARLLMGLPGARSAAPEQVGVGGAQAAGAAVRRAPPSTAVRVGHPRLRVSNARRAGRRMRAFAGGSVVARVPWRYCMKIQLIMQHLTHENMRRDNELRETQRPADVVRLRVNEGLFLVFAVDRKRRRQEPSAASVRAAANHAVALTDASVQADELSGR